MFNFRYVNFASLIRRCGKQHHLVPYRSILFSLIASVVIYFFMAFAFRQKDLMLSSLKEEGYSAKAWFFMVLKIMMFDAGILIVKYLYDNNQEKQRILLENETLKMEQLQALHQTLKQQVDPHFLFNSLNTLQSLVKQNAGQSLQFIKELSSVYRYMLVRRNKNTVTLREEIDFLNSYLYLLQIRFGNGLQTSIKIPDDEYTAVIPVYTLQLLAENAIKHNAITIQTPLLLSIYTKDNCLVVSNNILAKKHKSSASGIGLQNIQNRFRLLFQEEISIQLKDDRFTVLLPLIKTDENSDHRGRSSGSVGPAAEYSTYQPTVPGG